MIDLRSDTVTQPSPAMRQAMAEAVVGDDVYGEDPTIQRLEERAAQETGQEGALFVPSGTMGNQIALQLHARRGQSVVCEQNAHVFHYESGGMAVNSGLQAVTVPGARGVMSPEALREAIVVGQPFAVETGVVALENTHNLAGGTVMSVEHQKTLIEIAHDCGVPVHLDGARVWNAAAALGVPVHALTADVDSVMFCLSKGLGAPVGSLLCGKRDWIEAARALRRLLGGGMRQVGVLGAAGLYALEHNVARLADDHRRARSLAETMAELPGLSVDAGAVDTNIVVAESAQAGAVVEGLSRRGVLASKLLGNRLRLVTHLDIDDDAIRAACAALSETAGEVASA